MEQLWCSLPGSLHTCNSSNTSNPQPTGLHLTNTCPPLSSLGTSHPQPEVFDLLLPEMPTTSLPQNLSGSKHTNPLTFPASALPNPTSWTLKLESHSVSPSLPTYSPLLPTASRVTTSLCPPEAPGLGGSGQGPDGMRRLCASPQPELSVASGVSLMHRFRQTDCGRLAVKAATLENSDLIGKYIPNPRQLAQPSGISLSEG